MNNEQAAALAAVLSERYDRVSFAKVPAGPGPFGTRIEPHLHVVIHTERDSVHYPPTAIPRIVRIYRDGRVE